jgi:hypothetical protein
MKIAKPQAQVFDSVHKKQSFRFVRNDKNYDFIDFLLN